MNDKTYHYETITKAIRYLNEHKKQQPSLDEIAKHVHLSKFHFQRLFRQWAGVSPKDFLQYLTIEDAKTALRKGKSTMESAFEVGLSGNSRLHDLFLKIEACTPGQFKERGSDLVIKWEILYTPFGQAIVGETSKGICHISFGLNEHSLIDDLHRAFPLAHFQKELASNSINVKQYFDDWLLPSTTIQLDLKGTPFQIQVWKALLRIPSSTLISYQDLGSAIDRPNAVRAIGTAVGKNPIAYLIPCHRVIKANGHFGQYRWGSNRKMSMIGFEKATLQ